jgi:hypothetical protein
MPAAKKAKTLVPVEQVPDSAIETVARPVNEFDPAFVRHMREIVTAGLSPSSALDLVMRLIAEVPTVSKESMDQIKVLDKLINTARAMMETRLKTEEATTIAARIDELEHRLEALTAPERCEGATSEDPEE